MAVFHHEQNCGVVTFSAELSWDEARTIVAAVDTLVDTYFYTEVELLVSSPGGQLAAFDYCLEAMSRWRARGVRLRTHVVDCAESAAALMVSLGDERIAEPGARLQFHSLRYLFHAPVTAGQLARYHNHLADHDTRVLDQLVDRALRDAHAAGSVPAGAESSDHPVLERLVGADVHSGTNGTRGTRTLARALGRTVARAVRDEDRVMLGRLYRVLFALDLPISPRLARTLRLIDHVGRASPSRPRPVGSPGLTVPEWRALCPPDGGVGRELLLRNLLALGETGSGKTLSFVLPLLCALVRTPPGRFGGAFVVDPKRELGPVLERAVPGRVRLIQASDLVLNVMGGARRALESDLAAGRWLSAATRVVVRMTSFVPTSPAHVLVAHPVTDSNSEFFDREGTDLLVTVLACILMLTAPDAPSPEDWLDDDEALAWLRALLSRAKGGEREPGPNVVALASWALGSALLQSPSNDSGVVNARWLFARVARCASSVWTSGEARDVLDRVVQYWPPMVAIDRQYAGVLATARAACEEFADPSVSTTLYFGCEAGYGAARARAGAASPDFARLVSRDGDGSLVIFQPSRGLAGALVAMSLKATFFEAVLTDADRLDGRADLPLVGYVADEFHRYVTSDPQHGEQSFLDCCRGFQAFCALACQSVASVEHALACGAGNGAQDRAAVEILWTNCASKFFFRSTDPRTASRVDDLSPFRPGLAGVTRVRPLSTLAPGECYAALADARFERRQLAPFVEPGLERAPRKRARRTRGPGC